MRSPVPTCLYVALRECDALRNVQEAPAVSWADAGFVMDVVAGREEEPCDVRQLGRSFLKFPEDKQAFTVRILSCEPGWVSVQALSYSPRVYYLMFQKLCPHRPRPHPHPHQGIVIHATSWGPIRRRSVVHGGMWSQTLLKAFLLPKKLQTLQWASQSH